MDLKQLRVGVVGIAIGASFMLCLMFFFPRSRGEDIVRIAELEDQVAALSVQVGPLEREAVNLRQSLATCQGAQAGREASLEGFYQNLMFANRIDVVVFDEDGQAKRLVFDCGGNEQ